MEYTILDPTGNITALVESCVEMSEQPAAAAKLMRLHPEVEQVGFVGFPRETDGLFRVRLRMAGGEFCGNASMSAAALYCYRNHIREAVSVMLEVSGTSVPVRVDLMPGSGPGQYDAAVHMPEIISVQKHMLSHGCVRESLTLIAMEGISHLIIDEGSAFFALLRDKDAAEEAVKNWCRELSLCGLGLMFLQKDGSGYSLTPLVYVPGSGTVFWENSCASGTSAAAVYLAVKAGRRKETVFAEPGGTLRASCSPSGSDILLYGSVSVRQTAASGNPASGYDILI